MYNRYYHDQRIDSSRSLTRDLDTPLLIRLVGGNVPTGTTRPTFDVIISPTGGHDLTL